MSPERAKNVVGVLSAVLLGLGAFGLGQATSNPTVAVSDVAAAAQASDPPTAAPTGEQTTVGNDPSPPADGDQAGAASLPPSPSPTPQPAARIPTFDQASTSGDRLIMLGLVLITFIVVIAMVRALLRPDRRETVLDDGPELLRGAALLASGLLVLGAILLLGSPLVEVALDADHVRYVPGGPAAPAAPSEPGASAPIAGSPSAGPSESASPTGSPTTPPETAPTRSSPAGASSPPDS